MGVFAEFVKYLKNLQQNNETQLSKLFLALNISRYDEKNLLPILSQKKFKSMNTYYQSNKWSITKCSYMWCIIRSLDCIEFNKFHVPRGAKKFGATNLHLPMSKHLFGASSLVWFYEIRDRTVTMINTRQPLIKAAPT